MIYIFEFKDINDMDIAIGGLERLGNCFSESHSAHFLSLVDTLNSRCLCVDECITEESAYSSMLYSSEMFAFIAELMLLSGFIAFDFSNLLLDYADLIRDYKGCIEGMGEVLGFETLVDEGSDEDDGKNGNVGSGL